MSKTKITKKEVIEGKDDVALVTYLAQNNSLEYNLDKAIEEALEFAEVLVKLKTKNKNNPKRPKEIEALKEFGDLMYRGAVALESIFMDNDEISIEEEIEKHIDNKLGKLRGYLEKGTYKGGL